MSISQAKIRAKKLRELINKYRNSRLVLNKELISPEAEDSLKKELFDLEEKYPELITPDSPTQRVGGKPLDKFKKVEHEAPMYSLNDVFSDQDFTDWLKRLGNLGIKRINEFYVDLKMDGLAVELVYEKGLFVLGSTRGDGQTGEDVTQNLKTIESIPLRLDDDPPEKVVIRGEVFLSKKEFNRINKEQSKKGGKIYANPRNIAAGTIRQLDPKITAERKLDFFGYSILGHLDKYPTHDLEYIALNKFGIKTNPNGKVVGSPEEIIKFQKKWEKEREKLDYEIDGLVVSINDRKLFERAGVIGKAPRGGVAFKFSPKEAQTLVEDIVVSVGRTGKLTPIAILRPVNIGGVTVSRATLHNLDEIERLGVKIGDTVIVGRAGDVIPDVIKVLTDLRTGKEKKFAMPKICPVCKEPVERKTVGKEKSVDWYCVNFHCPAKNMRAMEHFVSAFDIYTVGPKILTRFKEEGLISDIVDLFYLKKEDIQSLERFGEKSAENIIASIKNHKKITLPRFIYALGIPHVGGETAFDLAKNFGSIEKLIGSSLEKLSKIPNIGLVVAKSVYDWFRNKYNQKLLDKFKKAGIKIGEFKADKKMKKLANRTFVFTGSLEVTTREDAQNKVREFGGDVSSVVSKSIDYVVAGSEPGSKYEKAKKLGIKVISEKEFLAMIK